MVEHTAMIPPKAIRRSHRMSSATKGNATSPLKARLRRFDMSGRRRDPTKTLSPPKLKLPVPPRSAETAHQGPRLGDAEQAGREEIHAGPDHDRDQRDRHARAGQAG